MSKNTATAPNPESTTPTVAAAASENAGRMTWDEEGKAVIRWLKKRGAYRDRDYCEEGADIEALLDEQENYWVGQVNLLREQLGLPTLDELADMSPLQRTMLAIQGSMPASGIPQ